MRGLRGFFSYKETLTRLIFALAITETSVLPVYKYLAKKNTKKSQLQKRRESKILRAEDG